MLVLAPYDLDNQTSYHRALIVEPNFQGRECTVKFVDYGNYEQVPKNAIKPIPTDIVKNLQCRLDQVPHLAVKYKLKGVKSRIRYSEKPDRYSIGLHLGQIYEVEIFSTFSGEFVKVDVFDDRNGRRIFLNDELCKPEHGYCDREEENAADVSDGLYWANRHADHTSPDTGLDSAPDPNGPISDSSLDATIDKSWIPLTDTGSDSGFLSENSNPRNANNKPLSQKKQKIQGPYNLYQTCISSLPSKVMRRCDIQNGSVNSIICNARPATNPKRMVVGNEVSIVGSGSIQATYTTMMPDIKGIVPLIYMIFAPRLSYRETTSDNEKVCRARGSDFAGETVYTGVLCGMGGQNPRDMTQVRPIYKEHDVELVFDVEIDSTDVNTADIIRKKLQDFGGDSEGHRLSNRTDNEVLANQRDIRQQIYKYIFRKRQDVKPIKWPKQCNWTPSSLVYEKNYKLEAKPALYHKDAQRKIFPHNRIQK